MTTVNEVLRNALTGIAKGKPPTFVPRISIKQLRVQEVLNRLPQPAGWFLEYCAHPTTRPEVEKWIAESAEK